MSLFWSHVILGTGCVEGRSRQGLEGHNARNPGNPGDPGMSSKKPFINSKHNT